MTEEEIKILVERLTKVWKPKKITKSKLENDWYFIEAFLENGLGLDFAFYSSLIEYEIELWKVSSIPRKDYLAICFGNDDFYNRYVTSHEEDLAFEKENMFFFKFKCWLSGVPFEISQHDKMEYLEEAIKQGFTEKDLINWGLI